jgi:hypothetical protein
MAGFRGIRVMKTYLITAAAAALMMASLTAGGASAQSTTTFADISPVQHSDSAKNPDGKTTNVQWVNGKSFTGGGLNTSTDQFSFGTLSSAPATSAVMYSVQFPNEGNDGNPAAHPGGAPIDFSFVGLGALLDAAIDNVPATMDFQATTTDGATKSGSTYLEDLTGSFAIYSTAPITIGTTTYATGTLLLGATFGDLAVDGRGNTFGGGSDNISDDGDTMDLYSQVVNFSGVNPVDNSEAFSFAATGLSALIARAAAGDAIESVAMTMSGNVASNPLPTVNATPEPASWALMIVGVGAVGGMMRRRRQPVVA